MGGRRPPHDNEKLGLAAKLCVSGLRFHQQRQLARYSHHPTSWWYHSTALDICYYTNLFRTVLGTTHVQAPDKKSCKLIRMKGLVLCWYIHDAVMGGEGVGHHRLLKFLSTFRLGALAFFILHWSITPWRRLEHRWLKCWQELSSVVGDREPPHYSIWTRQSGQGHTPRPLCLVWNCTS